MLFYTRIKVGDNERVILFRHNRFLKIYGPGVHIIGGLSHTLHEKRYSVTAPIYDGEWVDYLVKQRPEVVAEHFILIETNDNQLAIVFLDGKHAPLGWLKASTGATDRALVDPRIIFGIALQTAASALIVAHNHPSGSLEPSAEDVAVTTRLRDAGNLLSIKLLDHLILGKDAAFSFADSGDIL
jgi:DNA repair protein RadC